MKILNELRKEIEEIEDAKKFPPSARVVIDIAKRVDEMELKLPRALACRAIVQACLGKLVLLGE